MKQVSEILKLEEGRSDVVTSDGDVHNDADFRDADDGIINIPDYAPAAPAPSERDLRIAELTRQQDMYGDYLDKQSDKLGWSLDATRAEYGDFPGAKELSELLNERDLEKVRLGAAGMIARLRYIRQLQIYKISDPTERVKAQREFDVKCRLADEKNNRPAWDR